MIANPSINQNFLNNKELVKKLIKVSQLSSSDLILDIGVGKGMISKSLAELGFKVLGFEIDPSLKPENLGENVEIKYSDFLSHDLRNMKNFSVWSNIPYNQTSKITQKLLITTPVASKVCLIVQEEAANRLLGIKEGLLISLLILNNYEPKVLYKFKKSDFTPKPRVNSVLIEFVKRSKPFINETNLNNFLDFICYVVMQQKPTMAERLEKLLGFKSTVELLNLLKIEKGTSLYQIDKLKFFEMSNLVFSKYQNNIKTIKGSYLKYQEINNKNQKVFRTRLAQK